MIALLAAAAVVAGLDHLQIAVADLEASGADYRALGFTLKPGKVHDNGIRNLHAKFRDGSELELITAAEARDAMTASYVKQLRQGEGPDSLGLFAPDTAALLAKLESAKQPYTRDGLIELPGQHLFFAGRNASPTDLPEHFQHSNGADGFIGVWFAGSLPQGLLTALGAKLSRREVRWPAAMTVEVAAFAEGEIALLPESRQLLPGRPVFGAVVRTRDLEVTRRALKSSKVIQVDRSLFVPPELAHGLWLELREKK